MTRPLRALAKRRRQSHLGGSMDLSLPPTLGLIALATALGAFCAWRGAKPPTFKNGQPRMIPWRPLMVVSAMVAMLLLAHAAALLGVSQARIY